MKARFSYPLLFFVPAAIVSAVAAVLVAGMGAGLLWIFVYGDNPWPDTTEQVLTALSILIFALGLGVLLWAGYSFGKRQESLGGLTWKHVFVAIAVTVLFPALILLRQWRMGA